MAHFVLRIALLEAREVLEQARDGVGRHEVVDDHVSEGFRRGELFGDGRQAGGQFGVQ